MGATFVSAWLLVGYALGEELLEDPSRAAEPVRVGPFAADVLHVYTAADGLPTNDVRCVLATDDGRVYAGTAEGLGRWDPAAGRWTPAVDKRGAVRSLACQGDSILAIVDGTVLQLDRLGAQPTTVAELPPELAEDAALAMAAVDQKVYVGGRAGLFVIAGGSIGPAETYNKLAAANPAVRQLAASERGDLAVAGAEGLFVGADDRWQPLYPRADKRSWLPVDVRGVAYDRAGRLWFASPQGVGCGEDESWRLYTGAEGLPYDDFTTAVRGEDGVVWFGTKLGAIRFDGARWNYRQGRRWTPHDDIRSIAVDAAGNAWLATSHGVGRIERRPMTLAEKARFYEDEIDRYHRRTPYGYVDWVTTSAPGTKAGIRQHDSDNDGLWTSMYGAGECFAYAATKDPQAKERANAAFDAVKFLSDVTQGGTPPARKGFPARSILPTSGADPNDRDNAARDRAMREHEDPHWKELSPRWPVSADKKWYWKTDTSSDELDGHYFLYAAYHDLVAETTEEKERVRQVVYDVTSHLVEHDYALVDHDGQPTRWARFNRQVLDHGHLIDGRGLNSLSILSYLKTAEHITGDSKFREHYDRLVREHSYAANTFHPKWSLGHGTGNQSDDEMAFMCYYNLLRYETDAQLLKLYRQSLSWYWLLERPECNPLFNFIFAAVWNGSDGYPARSAPQDALDDAVDTLKRLPLDRFDWAHRNSHRTDVVKLANPWFRNSGCLAGGKVIPVDERHFEHWNHNPWRLDTGGSGQGLADGAVFLLPYYLGLHHGFIQE
ncbi:MAG: hypothetical protein DCC67_17530 [Planctomycetota bacterium]|nr:MAG: hypothetical protein DCC67_17530 [Planctomycetota bacterium]